MAELTRVLASPYGALLVGLVVLAVEFAVKAMVERGKAADPTVSQTASNVVGDLTQTVDARRSLTINQARVVNHFQAPPERQGSTGGDGNPFDDDALGRLVVYGVLVIAAGGLSTAVLAQHGRLVVNVLVGLAAGTALAALHLWLTHRRSLLPVGQWAVLTGAAAGALVVLSTYLLRGGVGGVDLQVIAEEVRGLGLWDAGLRVAEHGIQVSVFFLAKALGVLVATFVALVLVTRLLAMTVALSALDSGRVRRWHVWVVERLFPTESLFGTAAWGAFGLAFSYLLVSGTAYEWYVRWSTGSL